MEINLKSKGLILFSLLLVSLLVFVGCGEDEEVITYDIAGEVVGLDAEDLEHVRISADDETVTPETEGEDKGKWSISDVTEGSTVSAIIDTDNTTQNFEFARDEYTVDSDDDDIVFAVTVAGKSYYGYEESLELAPLKGESFDEEGAVARDVETVLVIDFEGDGISPTTNDLLLEEQITVNNDNVDDFSVNFLNKQVAAEDIEDYKLPDNYYDEDDNPVDGYDGVWEYWENVDTDYYYKSLIVRIPGRVAGDISVEIDEGTFEDADGKVIRKIETTNLALSDDTRLDDAEDDIVSLDHYNQELTVFNSDFDEAGDDLMPSINAFFEFNTVCNGAEIIKIAGEDVERIAEDSDDFVVEEGDELVVRAEDGTTTEYEITLVEGTDDVSLSSKQDVVGDDYFGLTEATEDEFGTIESAAAWLHWGASPIEVEAGLEYADEITDENGTEIKIVEGSEINRSTYHDDQGYWPENDMWDSADKDFNDLDGVSNFDKDNITDGIGYNLVLQSLDGSIAIYDLIFEEPRTTVELSNLYDEDDDDYEDREDKVFAIDNDDNLITLRIDLDGSLNTAEHPSDADNPANAERNVLATNGLNLLEAIEGGTIADVEDNEVKVVAEDGRSEEVYDIEYAPGFIEAEANNKNPYQIAIDLGGDIDTSIINSVDTVERFEVTVAGEEVEVEALRSADSANNVNDVVLELDTKIIEGDEIEVAYDAAEDADDEYFFYDDVNGTNLVTGFAEEIKNEIEALEYEESSYSNKEINITFNEDVQVKGASDAEALIEQFSIEASEKVNDELPSITNVKANDDDTVTLVLEGELLAGDKDIEVFYTPDPQQDDNILTFADTDNDDDRIVAQAFGDASGEGEIDLEAAEVDVFGYNEADYADEGDYKVEVEANAAEIEIEFTDDNVELNGDIDWDYYDYEDWFTVEVNGEAVEIAAVNDNNDQITIELEEKLLADSEVEVSYQPGFRTADELPVLLQDENNNAAVLAFEEIDVINRLEVAEIARFDEDVLEDDDKADEGDYKVEVLQDEAAEIEIEFTDNVELNGDIDSDYYDAGDWFTVEVNGEAVEIAAVNDNDDQITIELEEKLLADSEVEVSYQFDELPYLLQDAGNHSAVLAFEGIDAINRLGIAEVVEVGLDIAEEYTSETIEVEFDRDVYFDLTQASQGDEITYGFTVDGIDYEELEIEEINQGDDEDTVEITLIDEYDDPISLDANDTSLEVDYDADEGHLRDDINDHLFVESFNEEVVNDLESVSIYRYKAGVEDESSKIVTVNFKDTEDDSSGEDMPVTFADLEDDESETDGFTVEVEDSEIDYAINDVNLASLEDDDYYEIKIELTEPIAANDDVTITYDADEGHLVDTDAEYYPVASFEFTLDDDLSDRARSNVDPLEMESARVPNEWTFENRDEIIVEFNKDLAGEEGHNFFDQSGVETIHNNFIVNDGDYTVVDVTITDDRQLIVILAERVNISEDLTIEYEEESKETPFELSDEENNYLQPGEQLVDNQIAFPEIASWEATEYDEIEIAFEWPDEAPVVLERHGEIEIEFDGESESFAADSNVNADSISFTLEDMVVYEDEDEEKAVTISAPENSVLEMIYDYYNLAEDYEELVITDLPDNPVDIESASMANPGDNTIITLEMSHDVEETPSAVLSDLDVIKSSGSEIRTDDIEIDEKSIEIELDERLSGDDGNLSVYYRGDSIIGDVDGHEIPAPDFSIDVNNELLPEAEDISTDSSAEIEAIDGDDDFEEPEAIETDLIDLELEVEDNSGNAIDGDLRVELIDKSVTDIDENEAARNPFDDDVSFNDGEAEIDFNATLPDADEDDDYDAGDDYDFEYDVRITTPDGYVIIDTIELTVTE